MSVGERVGLRAELVRELARGECESTVHEDRVQEARLHVDSATERLRCAKGALADAEAAAFAASSATALRITRIEQRLRAGASGQLAAFCHDILDELDLLRARGVIQVHEVVEDMNHLTGAQARHFVSNRVSVDARRTALLAALEEAKQLQLEALPEEEITTRLTLLRDSIPEIEPLLVECGPLRTPYEARRAQWRQEEAQ